MHGVVYVSEAEMSQDPLEAEGKIGIKGRFVVLGKNSD